jgi:hypothetical protein
MLSVRPLDCYRRYPCIRLAKRQARSAHHSNGHRDNRINWLRAHRGAAIPCYSLARPLQAWRHLWCTPTTGKVRFRSGTTARDSRKILGSAHTGAQAGRGALTQRIVGVRFRRSCSPIGGSMFACQTATRLGYTVAMVSKGKTLVVNSHRSNNSFMPKPLRGSA